MCIPFGSRIIVGDSGLRYSLTAPLVGQVAVQDRPGASRRGFFGLDGKGMQ